MHWGRVVVDEFFGDPTVNPPWTCPKSGEVFSTVTTFRIHRIHENSIFTYTFTLKTNHNVAKYTIVPWIPLWGIKAPAQPGVSRTGRSRKSPGFAYQSTMRPRELWVGEVTDRLPNPGGAKNFGWWVSNGWLGWSVKMLVDGWWWLVTNKIQKGGWVVGGLVADFVACFAVFWGFWWLVWNQGPVIKVPCDPLDFFNIFFCAKNITNTFQARCLFHGRTKEPEMFRWFWGWGNLHKPYPCSLYRWGFLNDDNISHGLITRRVGLWWATLLWQLFFGHMSRFRFWRFLWACAFNIKKSTYRNTTKICREKWRIEPYLIFPKLVPRVEFCAKNTHTHLPGESSRALFIPDRWRSRFHPLISGHVNSPSQKGHGLNHLGHIFLFLEVVFFGLKHVKPTSRCFSDRQAFCNLYAFPCGRTAVGWEFPEMVVI